MSKTHKFLSLFLSLLLVVTNFEVTTHDHEDKKEHLDCPVCILQHSQYEAKDTKLECKTLFLRTFYVKREYKSLI